MNAFVKGQIIAEIQNPNNEAKRFARMGDETMILTGPDKRVIMEVFNDWDSGYGHSLKLGGKEVFVDDKDFNEIANALRSRCDAGKVEKLSKEDQEMLALLSGAKQK